MRDCPLNLGSARDKHLLPMLVLRLEEQAAGLIRQGLLFFRKVSQAVKKQLCATASRSEAEQIVDSLVQLFNTEDEAFVELETAVTNDRLPI